MWGQGRSVERKGCVVVWSGSSKRVHRETYSQEQDAQRREQVLRHTPSSELVTELPGEHTTEELAEWPKE